MKGKNTMKFSYHYLKRCVKIISDFVDILLLAENVNMRKPRDLILKSANLDNVLNLDNTILAWKCLISRMLENFHDVEDILSLRGNKKSKLLGIFTSRKLGMS